MKKNAFLFLSCALFLNFNSCKLPPTCPDGNPDKTNIMIQGYVYEIVNTDTIPLEGCLVEVSYKSGFDYDCSYDFNVYDSLKTNLDGKFDSEKSAYSGCYYSLKVSKDSYKTFSIGNFGTYGLNGSICPDYFMNTIILLEKCTDLDACY